MPEGTPGLAPYFRKALKDVERGLAVRGVKYERLVPPYEGLLSSCRRFGAIWVLDLLIVSHQVEVLLCVDEIFPFSKPDVFLRDVSLFLKIPHVEKTGRLCIIPAHGTSDPDNPVSVVNTLLDDAIELVADGLSGKNRTDFLDEFLSYWPASVNNREVVMTLVEPAPPSRAIVFWRDRNRLLFCDNENLARIWLQRAFPGEIVAGRFGKTVLIWQDKPPTPEQYPETNSDIAKLASESKPSVLQMLIEGVRDCGARDVPVLLCFGTDSGPGFVAVDLTTPHETNFKAKSRSLKIHQGFRSIDKMPSDILGNRYLAKSAIILRKEYVQRVDPEWILNRGGDGLGDLFDKHVCVIGCGSIGAVMAWELAQAGVGQLTLIDPDCYSWDNTARHILDGYSVGKNKAEAVGIHIMRQMPQINIEAKKLSWEDVWRDNEGLFQKADLIISATGVWESELGLNVLKKTGVLLPPLLFVWSEVHALAGHSLLVMSTGGCLACGMEATGTFRKRALDWDTNTHVRRVPACGGFFHPYGAINASAIRRMGTEHAIEVLLGGSFRSNIRSWVSSKSAIEQKKGLLRTEFCNLFGGNVCGDQVLKADWPADANCFLCKEK